MPGGYGLERECLCVRRRLLVRRNGSAYHFQGLFCRSAVLVLLVLLGLCRPLWAEPCGLRGYDEAGNIVELDCQTAADFANNPSSLHVRLPSGDIRGILLVAPTLAGGAPNPAATKFRVHSIQTIGGTQGPAIMAIGKIVAGISECEELQMIGYHTRYPANGIYDLADTDCSGTDANSDLYKGINCAAAATTKDSLWKCGYAARFPNGYKGVKQVTADENATIAALSQLQLGAQGFKPIPFSGTFNGNSKKITNLTISRGIEDLIGFFGTATDATIGNVGLEAVNILGRSRVGALAGKSERSTITQCYSTGSVTALGSDGRTSPVGGLVGQNWTSSLISNSYSTCSVTGLSIVGGLVGGNMSGSSITGSYSSGHVTSTVPNADGGGGLVGLNGDIATGYFPKSLIFNCYSTANVSGDGELGGLVGLSFYNSRIMNSYSNNDVRGSYGWASYAAGLVGHMLSGEVFNSFTVSTVYCISGYYWGNPGGLVGHNSGYIKNCAWNKNAFTYAYYEPAYAIVSPLTATLASVSKGTDSPNKENFYFKTYAVYQNSTTTGSNAWDFDNIWREVANGLPRLRWQS